MATAERLRELLLTPEAAVELDAPGSTDAAVLIPLFERGGELHAVFTERRADLRRHGGEISFPGGRRDLRDADLSATALREAHEEIGLPTDAVQLVGALPPTGTFVTDYRIHPFVGVVELRHEWRTQPTEVEAVLELSLPALVRGYAARRLWTKGVPFKTPTYAVDGNFVWGATARIVEDLLDRLSPML
ncbi:MAG: CoA pyrophosphatase [Actinomycetota bacterium]|nr:CoA pyrophosphatase [Actinomycetota bacterium]